MAGALSNIVSDEAPFLPTAATSNTSFYFSNRGKRQAVKDFCRFITKLDKKNTIRIFTDESEDWLKENPIFFDELSNMTSSIMRMGFKVQRIRFPAKNTDGVFRDTERWLGQYMSGTMKLFYYPWSRDELHRKTLFVIPGQIALTSMSIAGQRESTITMLTREPEVVASYDAYFSGILERSRSTIDVYSINEKAKMLERIKRLSREKNFGIYKSSRLSAHTFPEEAIQSAKRRSSVFTRSVLECYGQTEHFKEEVLKSYTITDIMCLPNIENVMNGTEPIPGTIAGKDTLYYTPREYLLHLGKIIWYLENYSNYRAVLLNGKELENTVIYTKGYEHAILIKETEPITLFEITERDFATSISEYLRHISNSNISPGTRMETIERLSDEITMLTALINL